MTTALQMDAEATAATGVVIIPHAEPIRGCWSGLWELRHVASGHRMGQPLPLAHAREAGVLLSRSPVDWTRGLASLTRQERALGRDIMTRVQDAAADGVPAYNDCQSFVRRPPLYYLVEDPAALDTADLDDLISLLAFPSWTDVVAAADAYHCHAEMPMAQHIVVRGRSCLWQMHCCAPLCRPDTRPALLGEDEYYRGCVAVTTAELAAIARDEGWIRVDPQRWMCPRCAWSHTQPDQWTH